MKLIFVVLQPVHYQVLAQILSSFFFGQPTPSFRNDIRLLHLSPRTHPRPHGIPNSFASYESRSHIFPILHTHLRPPLPRIHTNLSLFFPRHGPLPIIPSLYRPLPPP